MDEFDIKQWDFQTGVQGWFSVENVKLVSYLEVPEGPPCKSRHSVQD